MKKPRLRADLVDVEGHISIPEEWRQYDALIRADLLQDWIALLEDEYTLAVKQLFRGKDVITGKESGAA